MIEYVIILFIILIFVMYINWGKKFEKKEFIDMFGEQSVKCGVYFDGIKPTLIPQKIVYFKLEDLINGNIGNLKNVMCKIQFENTDNELAQYFDDITGNKQWDWLTVRISYGKWHFPEHYDCEENECFIISGERYVKINDEIKHLKEGDALSIKIGEKHEFWSDFDGLNILVNLFNKPYPIEIEHMCKKQFALDYPIQDNLNNNKFWKYNPL